jgi:hypothetical protein
MRHPILRLAFLIPCLLALASAPARGQQPDAAAPLPAVVTARSDGTVTATGPDYHVHATSGGVVFLALPGEATANAATVQPASLQFTLASVRCGEKELFAGPVTAAPIAASATQIRYEHTPTLTEVYDLRADGAEQSFVLARRPAGHGHLVVRGAITTQLPLASYSDDGVRYEQNGRGVAFGAVTGIDANGASVRGSIRAGADFVEWVLPASFVEHAAYPLVLDPLLGSAFSIASTSGTDDVQPNVAYDTSSDRYLVVWNLVQSSTVAEVRGQFLGGNGSLLGSSFVIESDGRLATRPLVVNINASNRFLVAFRRSVAVGIGFDAGWHVRAVTAADGSMSARVVFEPTPAISFEPFPDECAMAGDLRSLAGGSDQAALVVLRRDAFSSPIPGQSSGERLYTRKIQVPTSGDPIVGSSQPLLETSDQLQDLAITSHGGTAGRWLIVYGRALPLATTLTTIWAQSVDEDGQPCGGANALQLSLAGVGKPTAATKDGSHFAVAWQDDGTLGIQARSLTVTGNCGSQTIGLGAIVDPTSSGLDTQPRLEFARDKYVLAWKRSFLTGPVPRVFVRGLDPDGCSACGAEWSVDNTVLGLDTPAVASRWSGGNILSDEALVVWSNTAVRGRRFEASGAPQVADLGGGCAGTTGNAPSYLGQPRLGDAGFALTLPLPTAPVLGAFVGFTEVPLPCGPCTLIPNADLFIAGGGPHGIPIPCDPSWIGGQFTTQWLLFTSGGCPLVPELALSRAQRFTIVE